MTQSEQLPWPNPNPNSNLEEKARVKNWKKIEEKFIFLLSDQVMYVIFSYDRGHWQRTPERQYFANLNVH